MKVLESLPQLSGYPACPGHRKGAYNTLCTQRHDMDRLIIVLTCRIKLSIDGNIDTGGQGAAYVGRFRGTPLPQPMELHLQG